MATDPIEWVDAGTLAFGRMSFRIERNAAYNEHAAYRLTGKRGAQYILMRNQPRPYMLFAVNAKSFMRSTPFEWFTDRNGTLEVVR